MPSGPTTYAPAVDRLIDGAKCNDLGPGRPDAHRRAELAALSIDEISGGRAVSDREMAAACISGLWLRHDFLDESHRISQDIQSPTGSYWHGIMHRREPDYSNAKYWFRRVGRHPVFDTLVDEARRLANQSDGTPEAAFLGERAPWDPFAFVDLCQKASGGSAELRALCAQIQQREWELLFDYCYRHAFAA
ncbi:MAG: hypothetical protein DWQ37_04615 [Planctomycetota bacterium]|nr:MAG: hypothetical protein DWQ37_04615 [Planctomycetota bacterium]